MSDSPVKDWLKTKRVEVWPSVTFSLTDHRELEDAEQWFYDQLNDYLRHNGFMLAQRSEPLDWAEASASWPAPSIMDHEYALLRRQLLGLDDLGPEIPGLVGTVVDDVWNEAADLVDEVLS